MRSIHARSSRGCKTGKFCYCGFINPSSPFTRLAAFDKSDKSRRVREEVLNSLEAFTYRARDYLEDEAFIAASTSDIRSKLEEKLSAVSDWIYSEGPDATEDVLNAKLKELKDLVDPVLKRKDESSKRPDAIKELQEAIDGLKSVVPMVKEQIESASSASASSKSAAEEASKSSAATPTPSTSADPLDELEEDEMLKSSASESSEAPLPTEIPTIYSEEDLKFLEETIEKSTKWLEEKEGAQKKLKESEDPAFTVKELKEQTKKLNDAVMEMMTKKFRAINNQQKKKTKPKTKKPKKPKKTKGDEPKEEPKADDKKEPTEEELREALEKAGLKGEGFKLKNFGHEEEIKDKDGRPLVKLDLGEDASEEDIMAAIDKATKEAREELEAQKAKEKKHDEL